MEKEKQLNLITIGYAKRALEPGTRERLRMLQYASVVSELHIIVFTRLSEKFPDVQQEGNLFLYATNTKTRPGILYSAYKIGRSIIKKNNTKSWIVSSQDPFETALVGRAIASGNRATYHVQLHGDVFNPKSYRASFFQYLRVFYGRYVVRHTECIRVVSERLKRSLVSLRVPAESITVLPIQADLATFLEVGNKRTYQVHNPVSFLYVGRFSSEKNLPLMIEALKSVIAEFPKASLTLLGSGPLQSTLEAKVSALGLKGNVKFESWTNDVSSVMAAHDVLCLSSDHEGWAMVLLEAAASGMPVVTTDVGCAGEVVRENENGKVVPVGNVEEFAAALRQYCNNPLLISEHGCRSRELATVFSLSENEYLHKLVKSYTSCGEEKPAILTGNGKA